MNAIQIVRDSEQFPEMERIDENQVVFYFDHSERPYGENTQYMAVMVQVDYPQEEEKEDDIDEVKALALPDIKEYRIRQIEDYDKSSAVNGFTYQGVPMWLDKNTRAGLKLRFEAEEAAGDENTTLWYGTQSFTMPIASAKAMLNAIEVYASKCYDKTQEHKATVNAMRKADRVIAFDVTAGYPEKINFDVLFEK